MGNFYTNLVLRPSNQERVVETLKRLRRRAFVSPTANRLTVIYDAKSEEQDTKILCDLAIRLSKELKCAVWGALNHDDDVLWYALCSKGRVVDWYNSDPLYFEDSDEPSLPEGGDGKRLAQLMGCPSAADKLTKTLRRADDDYFAMDRHRDLVKAIGIDPHWVTTGFNDFESGGRVIDGTVRVGGRPRLPSAKRRGTQRPKDAGQEDSTW